MTSTLHKKVIALSAQGFQADAIARACNVTIEKILGILNTEHAQQAIEAQCQEYIGDRITEAELQDAVRLRALRQIHDQLGDAEFSEALNALSVIGKMKRPRPVRAEDDRPRQEITAELIVPEAILGMIQERLKVDTNNGQIKGIGTQSLRGIGKRDFESIVDAEAQYISRGEASSQNVEDRF